MQATGHLITKSLVLSVWFDPFRLLDKACFERAFADSFNPFPATGTSYDVRDKVLSTCFTRCCANSCLNSVPQEFLEAAKRFSKAAFLARLTFSQNCSLKETVQNAYLLAVKELMTKVGLFKPEPLGGMHSGELSSFGH